MADRRINSKVYVQVLSGFILTSAEVKGFFLYIARSPISLLGLTLSGRFMSSLSILTYTAELIRCSIIHIHNQLTLIFLAISISGVNSSYRTKYAEKSLAN